MTDSVYQAISSLIHLRALKFPRIYMYISPEREKRFELSYRKLASILSDLKCLNQLCIPSVAANQTVEDLEELAAALVQHVPQLISLEIDLQELQCPGLFGCLRKLDDLKTLSIICFPDGALSSEFSEAFFGFLSRSGKQLSLRFSIGSYAERRKFKGDQPVDNLLGKILQTNLDLISFSGEARSSSGDFIRSLPQFQGDFSNSLQFIRLHYSLCDVVSIILAKASNLTTLILGTIIVTEEKVSEMCYLLQQSNLVCLEIKLLLLPLSERRPLSKDLADLFWSSVFSISSLDVLHVETIRSKELTIAFSSVFNNVLQSGKCNLAAMEVASNQGKYEDGFLENLPNYLASVYEAGRVHNYSLFHMWLWFDDTDDLEWISDRPTMGDFTVRNRKVALTWIKTLLLRVFSAKRTSKLFELSVLHEIWSFSGLEAIKKISWNDDPLSTVPLLTSILH
jgi:hypothetical protein